MTLVSCSRTDEQRMTTIILEGICILTILDSCRYVEKLGRTSKNKLRYIIIVHSRSLSPNKICTLTEYGVSGKVHISIPDGICHCRMGLANKLMFMNMTQKRYETDLNEQRDVVYCNICNRRKVIRRASEGGMLQHSPINTIHTNVCDPFKIPCCKAVNQYVTFITLSHRYVGVIVIKSVGQ